MSKNQRILIVHNYYQIPGGEDTVVFNERKMLEDYGNKVFLYSRKNEEIELFNVIQKVLLPFTNVFSIKTYREVKAIIQSERIEVVHVHNTLSLISPSVYYAAFSCNIPVVQTIHNFRLICPAGTLYRDNHICQECIEHGLWKSVKYKCYRQSALQSLACVMANTVHRVIGTYGKINYICLTQFNKEKLLRINDRKCIIDPDRVFIKPNFVAAGSKIIPFEQRKNQFVFLGRLDKLKGIDQLLKIWQSVRDSELIVCGTGPLEKWCKQYIELHKMNNVKMLGNISNQTALEILSQSKAMILPTLWFEGFPVSVVEAFSVGTPVIGRRIGNVELLIENGVNGYLFSQNRIEEVACFIHQNINLNINKEVYKSYCERYSEKTNYLILKDIYYKCINLIN